MSETTASAEQAPEEEASGGEEARESLFFKKLDEDVWEAWVWTAAGLFVSAAIIWIVAYARLGYYSVYAYGVGIPLTSFMAVPIILWGLIKTMLNPPIFRASRSIGFVGLFTVAFFANSPMFTAPVSTEDWRSEHDYRLPFDGEWYTIAGGDELEQNYMVTSPAMRFGYAFTKLGPDGARFEGDDELELSSYHCYGQPVLAPTAATVFDRYDSQKDNVPGKQSEQNLLGNYVILEVDDEEFLVVAQLKEDSIPLEKGDRVEAGQKIGECGNSGAATHPGLLVYLVKDARKLVLTEGLPLEFSNYEVDGKRVVQGVPEGSGSPDDLERGQRVRAFEP